MRNAFILAAAVLVGAPAFAQELDEWNDKVRMAEIYAGIGVGNFTQDLGDVTDAGVAWNGRIGVQPLRFVGAELAYQGLNGDVGTIIRPGGGIVDDANITQHQFALDAKAGVPLNVGERLMRPYGLVGIGYTRLSADSDLGLVGLEDDNLFAVPLGAGVTYSLNETFAVDGRFTYNILSGLDQALVDDADSWSAMVNVGAQFGNEAR